MSYPFNLKLRWDDFDNTSRLTSYQKHGIRKRYKKIAKDAIQRAINQSVRDRTDRRSELNAHIDPDDPFCLDIGGQG